MAMASNLREYILGLIAEDKLYRFYKSKEWIELRDEVLYENHYECAICAARGKYTRATMVHHVNEVKKRPDMALTKEYVDAKTGERKKNLLPLCFQCHEDQHDRFAEIHEQQQANRFTNEERW